MDGGLGPGWVLTRYWICVCVWRAKQAATLHTVYWDAWTPGPRTTGYDWLALVQHWQLEAGALKVHVYIVIVMRRAEILYIKQEKKYLVPVLCDL